MCIFERAECDWKRREERVSQVLRAAEVGVWRKYKQWNLWKQIGHIRWKDPQQFPPKTQRGQGPIGTRQLSLSPLHTNSVSHVSPRKAEGAKDQGWGSPGACSTLGPWPLTIGSLLGCTPNLHRQVYQGDSEVRPSDDLQPGPNPFLRPHLAEHPSLPLFPCS